MFANNALRDSPGTWSISIGHQDVRTDGIRYHWPQTWNDTSRDTSFQYVQVHKVLRALAKGKIFIK